MHIKKEIIKRIVFGILMIVWMVVVFCFSNEQSTKSTSTSQTVIRTGLNQIKSYQKKEQAQKDSLVENLQYPTRKLAHFTIYTIGGLIIFNFINTFNISNKKKIMYAILFGLLYAISDEIHQLFTDGRSAQITDVLIDTSGVILGSIIAYLSIRLLLNRGAKKNGKQRI